ncbi:MAG: hypothetical protein RLZZ283_593, partial [Candidatus Parcubacteria bacterium]
MTRALLISLLTIVVFSSAAVAHAQYTIPGFTLQNNSQCVGGTLLLEYGDVQDTGAAISAKPLATMDCQFYMSGPGQCCSVQYRRATPKAPAIGSHVFMYQIYQGGTVGPSTPPAGTLTSSFQHWAGDSAGAGNPTPTLTASLVANPTSILSGEQSLLTWSSTGAVSCAGTNFNTQGATSGSAIVSPSLSTTYTVTCSGTGTQTTSPPSTINHGEADAYNSPAVIADMQASGINLPAVQGNTGFAND